MNYAEEVLRGDYRINALDGTIKYFADNTVAGIKEKEDVVNHPSHYAESCSIECIDAMECMFGTDKLVSFCFMNAFKYIWRFKNKNGLEDLKKARWYMNKAYETTHSESRNVSDSYGEGFIEWADEMYSRLDTLIAEAAFKGGFHGV